MKLAPIVLALVLAGFASAAQPARRPSDADRGRDLYQRHCLACHGAGARGDGPASAALVVKPGDLQGKVTVDPETIAIVTKGRGAMPAFDQTFNTEDAKRVLNHMKGLTDTPATPVEEPAAAPVPEEAPTEGGGG
ncbi:MAG: cytochrome c [Deltaproteobacteria bacterium]|nr:cytochrome c [Deltaproteobacteria bacterium]